MRAKSLVLLVVALGCGMVAAVAVSKAVMDQGAGQPAEATVEIYVAKKNLEGGQKLAADHFSLEPWPQSRLPEGAILKLEQIDGKYIKQNIFAGEPFIEAKLSSTRAGLGDELPKGYRVFDIPSGGITYIKPGDHVDVIGTFKLEGNGNVAESKTVMRNVRVFAINGNPAREADNKQATGTSTLQLQIKESQVEALTLANKLGEMRISLRSSREDGDTESDSEADNGDSFLSWVHQNEHDEEPAAAANTLTQTPPVNQLATNTNAPKSNKAEPNEMLIVTPSGVARYQWTNDKELPRLVTDADKEESKQSPPAPAQPSWPYPAGNVYSGFGGYTPTYPNGTSAPANGMQPGALGVPPTDASIPTPKDAPKID
ncbi:MAG: Flp pilus assembly protein CpaB [Pirellulaceae bacterium]|nr:Flp pilus assembly protein CpaB [Pirellulaceae bacterium]